MKTIAEIVKLGPVIPVLAFDSVEQGENVSRALHAGGVKVLEITLRTPAGLEAIQRASQLADDIVVGVGTITKPEHLRAGEARGRHVRRVAGPDEGTAPRVARRGPAAAAGRDDAERHHPGARIRLRHREVLPRAAGGRACRCCRRSTVPFPALKFCPTGGITVDTAPNFLKLPNVVCRRRLVAHAEGRARRAGLGRSHAPRASGEPAAPLILV
ncbi:bifunctional 4-hydroxy-2-oxoglutarate aldolase/2-dehydro-3-deoxy-phosphogluconate aldolase [Burkholderia cenocepacia]|uniref:bifunctional 4-hydroxy-2-oxoglutarate aldolase/2-dehydro-3-deoxy-phosphogluconate aldolase n=1 Tax=Burkholderia cenocepacia TaxID=95486 RepID=UPI003F4A411D